MGRHGVTTVGDQECKPNVENQKMLAKRMEKLIEVIWKTQICIQKKICQESAKARESNGFKKWLKKCVESLGFPQQIKKLRVWRKSLYFLLRVTGVRVVVLL